MTAPGFRSPTDAFLDAIERVATFAFQPIVNIHTGHCFGFEALLRNVDKLGFDSIQNFFDYAWKAGMLHGVDITLRRIAIAQFARTEACRGAKLFYNIDGRIFESQDYHPNRTNEILAEFDLLSENLVLELSERYDNATAQHLRDTLENCRKQNYQLAIDDFGRGFSEMQMLYEHHPDIIKIDRFFIHGVDADSKKRLFVSSIVNLAHVLGITVLAEGVETEREFRVCRAIGCDLVQGYFVARPTTEHHKLTGTYDIVAETNNRERRQTPTDSLLIRDKIKRLQPVSIDDDMATVIKAIRTHKDQSIFPVLGHDGSPVGLVRTSDFKDALSPERERDPQQDKVPERPLKDFLSHCPIADIRTEAEKILEAYAIGHRSDGILITENFRYVGFLDTDALLRILNEKNLNLARDRNPLSKLPGSNSVVDYIAKAGMDGSRDHFLVFFDFNHLRPFNDAYGFRQGDRAISLFADLLREVTHDHPVFLGHIGGDDFFLGLDTDDNAQVEDIVGMILTRFRSDVESFHSVEHRQAGGFVAKDRDGTACRYPLLYSYAAIVTIPAGPIELGSDALVETIAEAKKAAKNAPDGIARARASRRKAPSLALV